MTFTIFGMEFKFDLVSKEVAATIFMTERVEFLWKPQIVNKPIVSNLEEFNKLP